LLVCGGNRDCRERINQIYGKGGGTRRERKKRHDQ
jgi:hypothetical protein